MLEKKKLAGKLVDLIPMVKDDFERVYLAACDPEIWTQHPDTLRYTPLGFTKFFKKLLDTDIPYLIIDQQTQQVIGVSSFYEFDTISSTVVIGYTFLSKKYWGGQYNQEIKSLLLTHAFQQVDRVFFHVGKNNERSKRALKKIGAAPDEALNQKQVEKLVYSISKSTFLNQRHHVDPN
ncbi:MAG: GNAT family N-acetyltransferase [Sphingobacterium sp.]